MNHVQLLFLALAALVVAVPLAERMTVPHPVLLTGIGLGCALVPGLPQISLDPELILPTLLPPLLFTAAQKTSVGHLTAHLRSISSLAVALVVVSAFAVAAVVTVAVPEVPWPLAFAVGAATAPPDPVAATAVAGRLGLPHRVVSVIEGEGLVNDATSLVLYHVALTSAAAGSAILWWSVAGGFVYGTVVGLVVGAVIAWLADFVLRRFQQPVLEGTFTVVLPFAAYLGAEAVHASGVLAVVVVGLVMGQRSYAVVTAGGRMITWAFWETIELLLTAVAFMIIGLELRPVLRDAGPRLGHTLAVGLVVAAVLVLVRVVWMVVAGALGRPRSRIGQAAPENWREGVVMGWAGMRGVVTIAAALGLPDDVPARGELVLVAFVAVVVTLVPPGFTLPMVVRWLRVGGVEDQEASREVTMRVVRAVLDRVDELRADGDIDEPVARRLRDAFQHLVQGICPGSEDDPRLREGRRRARRRREVTKELMTAAQEEALRLRLDERVDPRAVDRVLRRIDTTLVAGPPVNPPS
ncbi:monovalent cation:H+ antiporter, CPA1 family [Streptoalloteichus tenebrarius]|uniref:Monovalent cation:H+ antiporter, CPA1 family n=1 Tax=Streptoalloteichus tenebrarius (strain ATCC 17920 / DSM 40477 / JCM 4838 / CBS 697.72 / NBRC 16177 / NCIMB 11028 / NRRL B-12390 / A12253. 1 / ISP 5477) TaxID=1933 RepID=A0ABT1HYL3_STRSD|nr:cation:proton antiporter [Streptoalloteichus tenebrarius]MCP2260581.1 monovalent cation:H+ antiporter, CPA1 family [Streptoalloteichus tenebrarius]BFF01925.1 Na+/H+ antiporter [Streptoalloteichus tenebrarius]